MVKKTHFILAVATYWRNLVPLLLLYVGMNCTRAGGSPDDWRFSSQRQEIAPDHRLDKSTLLDGEPTLYLSGNGREYSNGCWYRHMPVEPGAYYFFGVSYRAIDVDEPGRSVLARILWYDDEGRQIGRAEYPAHSDSVIHEGWQSMRQGYTTPTLAVTARLELIYRWDADGQVYYSSAFLKRGIVAPKRTVRLATIYHQPAESSGPEANLESFTPFLEEAGKKGADIICMPEAINLVGTGGDYVSVSETIPGPATDHLGKIAARHRCYIVAGLLERDGEVVYNTSVLIDREGRVAGRYRKLSLPREEIEGGVTPGSNLPVFKTDFGTVGMMICWDVTFPEVARHLAAKGAEVLFMPIWGGDLTLTRARAIENQVLLVTSGYDIVSAIFDKKGEILAEAVEEAPVAIYEVDLNSRELWPWLGDLKNRLPREMPAEDALHRD